MASSGLTESTHPLLAQLCLGMGNCGQLSPICAVFGGLVGAEVLKVLSGKDEPYQNVVLFDAQENAAVVQWVAPAAAPAK